jgi:hypothetical protein
VIPGFAPISHSPAFSGRRGPANTTPRQQPQPQKENKKDAAAAAETKKGDFVMSGGLRPAVHTTAPIKLTLPPEGEPAGPVPLEWTHQQLEQPFSNAMRNKDDKTDDREIYVFNLDCGHPVRLLKLPGHEPARIAAAKMYMFVFPRLREFVSRDLQRLWTVGDARAPALVSNIMTFFACLGQISGQAMGEVEVRGGHRPEAGKHPKRVDEDKVPR